MVKEKRVRIIQDTEPENPRDWNTTGKMYCWHGRYNLGDKHKLDCNDFMHSLAYEADSDIENYVRYLEDGVWSRLYDWLFHNDYEGARERTDYLIDNKVNKIINKIIDDNYLVLPLHLYDHSGITMRIGQFSCLFDSGQIGWIVCDKVTCDNEFCGDWALAEKSLRAEVKAYNSYLTGDVYIFIVEELDGEVWEHIESCGGFHGSNVNENGMAECLDDDLIEMAADAEIEYPSN